MHATDDSIFAVICGHMRTHKKSVFVRFLIRKMIFLWEFYVVLTILEETLFTLPIMSTRSKVLFHNNMFMIYLSLNNTGSPKHGRFVTMLQNEFMCL